MISVFGATGFIGSNFVAKFPRDTRVIERERRAPVSSEALYLISTTHNYHVFDAATLDVKTNLLVLMEVLEKCKGAPFTFNFVSSWFVYGACELPAREDTSRNPKGLYSITKSCAEDLVISFCRTHGMRYRILRLANVYGAGDSGTGAKKNALQFLIGEIKAGNEIGLYYGGDFVRDYIHVSDACRAIRHVMKYGDIDSVYNIGSGIAHNFRELILSAYGILGRTPNVKDISPTDFHRQIQAKNMVLDTTKLRELGFKPEVGIDAGLEEICRSES